jgi:hypothetical protein
MEFKGKDEYIKSVQNALSLLPDGIDGPKTWKAIKAKLIPEDTIVKSVIPQVTDSVTQLSPKAYKLILDYEVGGGPSYYNKQLKHPCYPGGESGVTIGIGYDMGYNTVAQFEADWIAILDQTSYSRLVIHLGKKGNNAKAAIPSVKDISIPWESAEIVFKGNTLPRFIKETKKAFPGAEKLHSDAFGALVSLVFNRGGSTTGSSRSEMLNIKNAIVNGHDDIYNYIAAQIIDMKRLWVGKGLDGLLTRRNDESKLVKSCV